MSKGSHRYAKHEIAFLKKHASMPRRELAQLFNDTFNTSVSYAAIKTKCTVLGFKTGRRKITECHEYSSKEIAFLKANGSMPRPKLTAIFNNIFDTKLSVTAIRSKCRGLGLRTNKKIVVAHKYTADEVAFLRNNETMPRNELAKAFNDKFKVNVSDGAIKAKCLMLGLKTGRDGRIKKGAVSWNKGKKGVCGTHSNCRASQFKKGHVPANLKGKGVGHERFDKNGHVLICIDETNPHTGAPRRYVTKHKWVWEKHNGPMPPNHCLRFLDGDKSNFEIENLILITRAENAMLNIKGFSDATGDIFLTALAAVQLELQANKKARSLNE
jgi:hypothetical protein